MKILIPRLLTIYNIFKRIAVLQKLYTIYEHTFRKVIILKVVAKPIEVISLTDTKGNITPLRLRIEQEDESVQVIKIDKIIDRTHEKLAGTNKLVFTCRSLINGTEKVFEIKYEITTCRWVLFKI